MNELNVRAFAKCDGTDETAALKRAIDVARYHKVELLVPANTAVHYSEVLTLDGVSVRGFDDTSQLIALNEAKAAIVVRGKGPSLRNLRLGMVPNPTARKAPFEFSRVAVLWAQDWHLADLLIERAAGCGIISSRGSCNGWIESVTVRGTLADAVHMTDGTSHVTVFDCDAEGCGDDGIAVVSKREQAAICSNIRAYHNRVRNSRGGRGLTVVGGQDVAYTDNFVENVLSGAGILVAQEDAYTTRGCKNVTVANNTVRNCGNVANGHTMVMVHSSGTEPNEGVLVSRNLAEQTTTDGWATPTPYGYRATGPGSNIELSGNVYVGPPDRARGNVSSALWTPYTGGPVGVMS